MFKPDQESLKQEFEISNFLFADETFFLLKAADVVSEMHRLATINLIKVFYSMSLQLKTWQKPEENIQSLALLSFVNIFLQLHGGTVITDPENILVRTLCLASGKVTDCLSELNKISKRNVFQTTLVLECIQENKKIVEIDKNDYVCVFSNLVTNGQPCQGFSAKAALSDLDETNDGTRLKE